MIRYVKSVRQFFEFYKDIGVQKMFFCIVVKKMKYKDVLK